MDINTRIANLAVAAACGPLVEQELLRANVILAGPHVTNNPGASAPLRVVLHPDRVAYFKRFCDQRTDLCAAYRHDRQEVPLNEVIAWRLAWAMGDPWAQLVPPSVLRTIDGAGGALTSEKRGMPDGVAVVAQAPEDVAAAAFWDALIGQQDRHTANFRFDATSGRLGLIDHGFSFRRDGDPINSSAFLATRHRAGEAGITPAEHDALGALLRSGDLHGLRRYLQADRVYALEARARSMLASGRLPSLPNRVV